MRKYFILLVLLISISIDVSCAELNYQSETVLEENEEVFFKFIYNADISPDSKKIVLLPSDENDRIFIYDAETMKFIQEIKADNSLINPILHKVEHYEKNHTIVPNNYNDGYEQLPNLICAAKFSTNDELQLLHRIKYYTIDHTKENIDTAKSIFVNMGAVLWQYNLSTAKYKGGIVFNDQYNNDSVVIYVQNDFIQMINDDYYLMATSDGNESIGKYDSNGKLKAIQHYFPKEFGNEFNVKFLNYNIKSAINNSNELLLAYRMDDRIYNATKGTSFNLKVKYNNTELLDKLLKDRKYLRMMGDTLWKQVKLKIQGLYSTKSNHTLVYIDYTYTEDASLHRESFLQIYDENNKFVQEFDIQFENAKGKLYYALFDKNTNRFFFFRKNKENWIVEKYKLEI